MTRARLDCTRLHCAREGVWAPKVCVPAVAPKPGERFAASMILGLPCCAWHLGDLTAAMLIMGRGERPAAMRRNLVCAAGHRELDFAEAWIDAVAVRSAEYRRARRLATGAAS